MGVAGWEQVVLYFPGWSVALFLCPRGCEMQSARKPPTFVSVLISGACRPIVVSILLVLLPAAGCISRDTPEIEALVPTVVPELLRTLPHDRSAFTQGLVYHGGKLYESTGLTGRSSLRCLDAANGRVEAQIPVPNVFAEGLALKDSRLVQLTWRSCRANVYSFPDMATTGAMQYDGEGWGLAANADEFVMSNGSDTLCFRDDDFAVLRRLPVTAGGRPLDRLNELEWARGLVYANVWFSDYIFEIDPRTGRTLRMVDCRSLVEQCMPLGEQEVLNGIAYNPDNDAFFVTGKNWPLIFEIVIPEK